MTVSVAEAVEGFLEHKRAIGRKYHSEEAELRLLVRFANARRVVHLNRLTPAVLEDFLASRPRIQPRSFNHLRGVVVCLMNWAVSQGLLETSPLNTTRRRVSATRSPFIFEPAQARRLLDTAAALPDNARAAQRGPTYHAIFALCYGLGLRAGEACHLRVGDIDTDRSVLVVVGGKFGKSRLVPHGPRIGELLAAQLERRRAGRMLDDDAPLFSFDGRRPITPCTASQVFHQVVATLDLEVPAGVRAPCLHSLRHSFAVGTLLRWYRDGVDPTSRLFHLATFMGHVDPTSTAVYLTITPALLDEANRRFEAFAQPQGAER
jgi:integrase